MPNYSSLKQQIKSSFFAQLKALWPLFYTIYLPLVIALFSILLQNKIPVWHLTRDSVAIIVDNPKVLEGPVFHLGAVSKIGILVWAAAATICLFTALLLRDYRHTRKNYAFFMSSAILTFAFLFDDFFLFHETIAPEHLHIPEKAVYLAYIIGTFAYFISLARTIFLKTDK